MNYYFFFMNYHQFPFFFAKLKAQNSKYLTAFLKWWYEIINISSVNGQSSVFLKVVEPWKLLYKSFKINNNFKKTVYFIIIYIYTFTLIELSCHAI